MNAIFDIVKKVGKYVLLGGLFLLTLLALILNLGGFGGGFFGVISGLFSTLFTLALIVLTAVFILIKQDKLAKFVFTVFASFYGINLFYNLLTDASWIGNDIGAYATIVYLFELLAAIAIFALMVMFVLGKILLPKLNNIVKIGLLVIIPLFVLLFILNFILCIVDKSGWGLYLAAVFSLLVLPVVISVGILYFDNAEE